MVSRTPKVGYSFRQERRRQLEIGNRDGQIDSIVREMQDDEESLVEQRLKAWDQLFKRSVLMLLLGFAVVTVMLAYNFRVLVTEVARTRETEKRVRANAESYRLMRKGNPPGSARQVSRRGRRPASGWPG
jgi:hypothetical protein